MVNLRLIIELVILVTLCYPIINGPPSELKNCLLFHVAGIFILLCCVVNFVIDKIISKLRTNANENKKELNEFKVESAPSQIAPPPASDKLKRFNERKRIRRQKAAEAEKQLDLLFAEVEKNNKILNEFREKSALSQIAPFSAQAQDLSQSNQLEQALSIPEAKQVSSASKSVIDRPEEIKERVTSNSRIKQNVTEDQKQLNLLSAEIEEKLKNLNKHEIKPAPSQIAPLSAPAREPRLMSQSNQLKQALAIPEKVTAANLCKSSHVLPSTAGLHKRVEPVKNIKKEQLDLVGSKESQSRSTGSSLPASPSKPAVNAALITDTSVKQELENEDELEKIISQYSLHLGSELEKAPIKPSSSAYSIWSQEIIIDIRDTLAVNLFRPCRTHEEIEDTKKMINPTQAFSLFDGNQLKHDAATRIQSTFRRYITKKRLGFIRRKTAFFDQISHQSGISIFGRMLDKNSGKFIPKSSNHTAHYSLDRVNNLAVIPWIPQPTLPSSHLSVAQWIQSHQSTAPLYPSNFMGKIASMGKMNRVVEREA